MKHGTAMNTLERSPPEMTAECCMQREREAVMKEQSPLAAPNASITKWYGWNYFAHHYHATRQIQYTLCSTISVFGVPIVGDEKVNTSQS